MATSLKIDLTHGLLEVEGEEGFVRSVYDDFKEELSKRSSGLGKKSDNVAKPPAAKTERGKPKKGGPSCASRILDLKNDDFFVQTRGNEAIREKLREKGNTYASNQIAAALTVMTRRGELRRVKEGGSWVYQNP